MSFITSQVTHGGIVMTADRYSVVRIFNPEKTHIQREISTGHIYQKLYVTKNNIGISCSGVAEINNVTIERYIYDFIWELDTEKYPTPYDVAKYLLKYFRELNPKLETDFHIGGYDFTDPKKPKPCLYYLVIDENTMNKVNKDNMYSGATFSSPSDFTEKIMHKVGSHYGKFTLRDAIEFAKFAAYATKDIMRFCGSNEAMSRELDMIVIRPDGVEWSEW